jgi:Coenzyme PQQ synthesis protein D (PqqD)
MRKLLPLARKDSLIVRELPDETLVYDRERDKAHCLNQSAALVWKYCDGRTTVAEIAQTLERELNTTIDDRVIWLALDELGKSDLLQSQAPGQEYMGHISRRRLVRTLGFMAVSIPLITSIVAPMPAQAASGLVPGSCCGNPNECQSNSCNPAGAGACPAQPSDKVCG